MYKFEAKETARQLIEWIKEYFENNGDKNTKAIIGISGGKDSSIVAGLCVEALGKDRVIGVKMPQGEQEDIEYAEDIIDFLGIKSYEINIEDSVFGVYRELDFEKIPRNSIVNSNTPARIRMTVLYAVSGALGGRVANTCNLSEDYVGYATKFGDGAGDFSPLSNLTVTEVKAIGREIGIPDYLIDKTPIDGLCGLSDEDNLGFSYDTLDKYIRTGICEDEETKRRIDAMHKNNLHKLLPMPSFKL
ncbi:NAD(+) synthase [Clostridium butyricum]|uniref:NAD(+) synthase n=1 Tax=Clostridium butyricum TaxID=1492 RepID=UPI00232E3A7D|nr:NAD(+) synthase [Clostridium butyricum]MDB2160159.1 NAD(+) synthase [Clostridium butyricum]